MITDKDKWYLAADLLKAKKSIDSLWYYSKHVRELPDIKRLCESKRGEYCIGVCNVLDKSICANGKKKSVVDNDDTVKRIYHERDKHYAHRDRDYKQVFPYASLEAEVLCLQKELKHIRKICYDFLPTQITLDFVCYDRHAFRYIEQISTIREAEIIERRCKCYTLQNPYAHCQKFVIKDLHPIYDIDEVDAMSEDEKKHAAVVVYNGITNLEGLQNRQDAMVICNVLHGTQMWCTPNQEAMNKFQQLMELNIIDQFGIPDLSKILDIPPDLL